MSDTDFENWMEDTIGAIADSQKTSNKNQPKYASALSGGNADKGTDSLESRYDSKKVENPQDDSGKATRADNEDNGHGTFPADPIIMTGCTDEMEDVYDS